ncbi:MAG: DUF167 domain-containing protein [bacterium]
MSEPITDTDEGCAIQVYAAPRSSRSKIVGLHDGRVKIQISAPPVDGAANDALIRFLAEVLNVPRAQVALTNGHGSKRKTLEVSGVTAEQATSAMGL